MSEDNLPPGCKTSDIPGNRPKDVKWEKFMASGVPDAVYEDYYDELPESLDDVYEAMEEDEGFKDAVKDKFKEGLR